MRFERRGSLLAIDSYIHTLPYLPVEPAQVIPGAQGTSTRDGDYSCTTENLKETRQLDRIVAYAANSDSLWPGAIVSADSVVSGLFTQVVLPRKPATFSVSLENLAGTKKATIDHPSLSTYRDALADVLASEITGSTPANIYSEIEEVHSEQQLNLALGVQASWALGLASLKSSFNWQSKRRSLALRRALHAGVLHRRPRRAEAPSAVLDPASRSTTSEPR